MHFSRDDLCGLASRNPRLAAILARGAPRDFKDEKYSIQGRFDVATVDSIVNAQLDHIVTDDFYVRAMTYTVEQPSNFPGAFLMSVNQYFNSLIPNIDVRLTATGWGGKYDINVFAAPIQNIAKECPEGWVLYAGSSVLASFFLRRALVFPGEMPTIVTITLQGCSLGCDCFDGLTIEEARKTLLDYDLLGAKAVAPTGKG
jgi:hypothetical protein